jgi:phage-related protein
MVLAPYAARADVITPLFFDGFDSDTPEVLNATLNNWNIPIGAVDVLKGSNLCAVAGNPSSCVDLDGTRDRAGTITSKTSFAVTAGTYRLSFDLAGANRPWMGVQHNTVDVSFGDYYSEEITKAMNDPFETYTRDVLVGVDGVVNIGFAHRGADWVGLLLDNVSLSHVLIVPDVPNEVPVETPEPATWTLLGGTLALLAWRFRKRHA